MPFLCVVRHLLPSQWQKLQMDCKGIFTEPVLRMLLIRYSLQSLTLDAEEGKHTCWTFFT